MKEDYSNKVSPRSKTKTEIIVIEVIITLAVIASILVFIFADKIKCYGG